MDAPWSCISRALCGMQCPCTLHSVSYSQCGLTATWLLCVVKGVCVCVILWTSAVPPLSWPWVGWSVQNALSYLLLCLPRLPVPKALQAVLLLLRSHLQCHLCSSRGSSNHLHLALTTSSGLWSHATVSEVRSDSTAILLLNPAVDEMEAHLFVCAFVFLCTRA